MFATLCFCLLSFMILMFTAFSCVAAALHLSLIACLWFFSPVHVVIAVALFAFAAGLFLGYHYRNAIGKDVSSLKVSAWITDLEDAAKGDLTELRTTASSVVSDLKKL